MSMIEKLIPMIEPSTENSETRVHRPLFIDHDESPLNVFYADPASEKSRYLTPQTFSDLGLSIEEMEKIGTSNWLKTHSDLPWEEIEASAEHPPVMRSYSRSQAVSSILLSHGHLKGMHQHFDAESIYVAIPNRFTVLVHSDANLTAKLAEKIYHESPAESGQLSPNIYLSKKGRIVGYVQRDPNANQRMQAPRIRDDALTIYWMQKVTAHLFTAVASIHEEPYNIDLLTLSDHLTMTAKQGQGLVNQACASMLQQELDILKESASMDSQSALFETMKIVKDLALALSAADYRLFHQASIAMTKRIGETKQQQAVEDSASRNSNDPIVAPDTVVAVFQSLFAQHGHEQSQPEMKNQSSLV